MFVAIRLETAVRVGRSSDGDEVFQVCFESAETLAAWRDLPEHALAQRIGRESIYAVPGPGLRGGAAYDFVHGR
jgi:heme-degrading monooxygenase HmoA